MLAWFLNALFTQHCICRAGQEIDPPVVLRVFANHKALYPNGKSGKCPAVDKEDSQQTLWQRRFADVELLKKIEVKIKLGKQELDQKLGDLTGIQPESVLHGEVAST